jgi:ketosteroid isomerase-like protein
MSKIAVLVAVSLLGLGTSLSWAADTSILDRHVANMKSGNIEGILADYAPDTVIVTPAGMVSPSGVFVGKDAKKLFSVLAAPKNLPGNKTMETKYESLGPDTTRMTWVQFKGTKDQVSGYDVFVVRGGKIAFQTVIVDAKK